MFIWDGFPELMTAVERLEEFVQCQKTDVVTKKFMMFHCHFTHPQTTPGNITFSQSQAGMVTINQLYLMKSHTDAILLVLHLNIITVALLHKSLQSAMSPFLLCLLNFAVFIGGALILVPL